MARSDRTLSFAEAELLRLTEENMKLRRFRYRVVFTPIGWQVVDTVEARDPIAEFGTGPEEYQRAKEAAEAGNSQPEPCP